MGQRNSADCATAHMCTFFESGGRRRKEKKDQPIVPSSRCTGAAGPPPAPQNRPGWTNLGVLISRGWGFVDAQAKNSSKRTETPKCRILFSEIVNVSIPSVRHPSWSVVKMATALCELLLSLPWFSCDVNSFFLDKRNGRIGLSYMYWHLPMGST